MTGQTPPDPPATTLIPAPPGWFAIYRRTPYSTDRVPLAGWLLTAGPATRGGFQGRPVVADAKGVLSLASRRPGFESVEAPDHDREVTVDHGDLSERLSAVVQALEELGGHLSSLDNSIHRLDQSLPNLNEPQAPPVVHPPPFDGPGRRPPGGRRR